MELLRPHDTLWIILKNERNRNLVSDVLARLCVWLIASLVESRHNYTPDRSMNRLTKEIRRK